MRLRTPREVVNWGVATTILAIAIVTALGRTRWLVGVLVTAGAVAIVTRLFWRWESGLFGTELRNAAVRVAEIPILSLFGLLIAFAFEAGFVLGSFTVAQQAPDRKNGPVLEYVSMVLASGAFCFLESVALSVIVVVLYSFYGLAHSRGR